MKKPEKCLTTTEFVLWITRYIDPSRSKVDEFVIVLMYARLMQTPSSLQIFVACKDGEPMQEPGSAPIYTHSKDYILEYQQAQKKVLFEGWAYYLPDEIITNPKLMNGSQIIEITEKGWVTEKDWRIDVKTKTIEDLARQIELIPTDNFWKQVGL